MSDPTDNRFYRTTADQHQINATALEAAAKALYLEDVNASMSPDAWPDWESDDNEARHIYRHNAMQAIAAWEKARR